MKKIIFALLILFTCKISAQEQTLLSGTITHGGYGGPEVKFTQIGDDFGIMVGGKGGWIINHTVVLGAGGYGLVNKIRLTDTTDLNFGYGGLVIEYIQDWDKLLHYSFSALIGGGGISHRRRNSFDNHDEMDVRTFFVLEPGANAEVNISSFFRINAGISYRLLSSVSLERISEQNLSGLSLNLTFKFGKFNKQNYLTPS
jgi:hypothetical protein